MPTSILDNTKKLLGIDDAYTAFDPDILMHINSVLSTLNQLGVGPEGGFSIESNISTWEDFLGIDPRLNSVKTYVYLKVRLLFDPPATSFTQTAIKEQIQEIEWRISIYREGSVYVPPVLILDGGNAII